ncbi:eCIS core domain-containing protein, partial [Streptomyces prunicolor]
SQAAGNAAVSRVIQRARDEERAEEQQGGPAAAVPVQRRASVVDAVGSPGRPLEPRILQRAERAYSMDFGHVRVHSDPVAQRSAEDLGALAYTTGAHIVLGGDRVEDEVMFEEVDHVRQQALGPVPGTDNGRGEKVSHPDDPFERSAGANGRKLARGADPELSLPGADLPGGAVQRSVDGDVSVQRADRPGPSTTPPAQSTTPPPTSPSPPIQDSQPAVARLAGLLVRGKEAIRNKDVRAVIHTRVRSGPSFTDEELDAIKVVESEDPKWLKTVGMCGTIEADAYLKAGDFHNWLQQPEGKRLLIATLRWRQEVADRAQGKSTDKPTRSDYQLARHHAMHDKATPETEKEQLTGERNEQIFQTFVTTMVPPGISDRVPDAAKHRERVERGTKVLAKIFLIMKQGLKVFNPETKMHEDFKDDVAHALAYGGRVNIRIPQLADGQHGYELPQWLHITKENVQPWQRMSKPEEPVYRRKFATHHMETGKDNADGTPGKFVEKGEFGATVQNWFDPRTSLYGLPTAAGGMGTADYHGDTILPNESYGHMFMGYKVPTGKEPGALQFGLETAGPGGTTPDGYKHGITSSEKNSNPVSQFGGHKDDKPGGNAPLSASQRHVDLERFGNWLETLKDLEKDWKAALAKAKTPEERAALYRDLIGKRTNIGS